MKNALHILSLAVSMCLATLTGCGDDPLSSDETGIAAKSRAAGPYAEASAIPADAFQRYVVDMLDFARMTYEDAPDEMAVHGIPHRHHPEWGTSKFRVFRAALDGPPSTISYVIAIQGTDSIGDFLRDAQSVLLRVRTTNPLTGEHGGRMASGFAALVRNYLTGRVGRGAWAGLLDDIEGHLDDGDRVEVAITGHSMGAAATYILSWYLWQYMDTAWRSAPVHIRAFAFSPPKTVAPLLARDYAEAVRSGGRGPFRLQAYSFSRRQDVVTHWGSPQVHHPMWAPNRTDGWVNPGLRFFGRRLRTHVGHCTHLELPARAEVNGNLVLGRLPMGAVLENHDIDLMRDDLTSGRDWGGLAQCMARPDAATDAPGFKTFWGP